MTSAGKENITFIYPRSNEDPSADIVRESFKISDGNFSSVLAVVKDKTYVGRTAAGGEGDKIDISGDGIPDAEFSKSCQFVMQLKDGIVSRIEVDRGVTATIQGQKVTLLPYKPVDLNEPIQNVNVELSIPNDKTDFKTGESISFETDVFPLFNLLKIEYFAGDDKIGENIRKPFKFIWRADREGNYKITAKAIFKDGVTEVSDTKFIKVTDSVMESGIINNLALNKTVTSSNQQRGNEAPHIVDGSLSKRWAAYEWPLWVQVDLGEEFNINKTEIAPYLNRAYKYKIEVSLDGVYYEMVVDQTENTEGGALFVDAFNSVKARFVRLTVTGATGYDLKWVSIHEFRIFGENLALNKTVTFSDQQNGNYAYKLVDGNDTLRWAAEGWPEWVQVDLGDIFEIKKTEILPYMNRAYKYNIEASLDGVNYQTVVDKSDNEIGGTILAAEFPAVEARFVRINITGATGYDLKWVSLYEFRVFGSLSLSKLSLAKKSDIHVLSNLEETKTKLSNDFIIYPNPESKNVKIKYFSNSEEKIKINVIDISGRSQSEKSYNVFSGENIINLDLINNLTNGVYIINLSTSNGKSVKRRFIKAE